MKFGVFTNSEENVRGFFFGLTQHAGSFLRSAFVLNTNMIGVRNFLRSMQTLNMYSKRCYIFPIVIQYEHVLNLFLQMVSF